MISSLKHYCGLQQLLASVLKDDFSFRSNSVLLEHEMILDGTVVSAVFDDIMDMGIVGTTAGTLWYINWAENTSIRLISGHRNKARSFPNCSILRLVTGWKNNNNQMWNNGKIRAHWVTCLFLLGTWRIAMGSPTEESSSSVCIGDRKGWFSEQQTGE